MRAGRICGFDRKHLYKALKFHLFAGPYPLHSGGKHFFSKWPLCPIVEHVKKIFHPRINTFGVFMSYIIDNIDNNNEKNCKHVKIEGSLGDRNDIRLNNCDIWPRPPLSCNSC